MIFFFQPKEISYPFPSVSTEINIDSNENDIKDIHRRVASILFFEKNYSIHFQFKKNIYKYHFIEINVFQFKNIYIVQKIFNYNSNEYFLALYGINSLREYIPSFSYTFFQKDKNELWIEYQDAITIQKYIEKYEKMENINKEYEAECYLSIFFQIVCSLEFAQEKLLFTHYDLHLENIMIKNKKKILSFPIYDEIYFFENETYPISIIDFEHSSIRYKDKIINSVQNHLFSYGYLSIFFSSVDILRYILCFQYKFFHYSSQKSHFIHSIFEFHNLILTEFYGFCFEKNNEDIKHALNYHSTYFFNLIFSKKIYKTPY